MGQCFSSLPASGDPLRPLQSWIDQLDTTLQYYADTYKLHKMERHWHQVYYLTAEISGGLADILDAVSPRREWGRELQKSLRADKERIEYSMRDYRNVKCDMQEWLLEWRGNIRNLLIELKAWLEQHRVWGQQAGDRRASEELACEVRLDAVDMDAAQGLFWALTMAIHDVVQRGCEKT